MNIQIVPASYGDVNAIKKIAIQHPYTKHFSFFGYCNRDKFLSGDIIKAVSDNEIIGFMVLSQNKSMSYVEIDIIGVDEDWRSKGIGKLLIDYVAERNKYPIIVLFVQKDNARAIQFYEQNGFDKVSGIEERGCYAMRKVCGRVLV